VSLLIAGLVGVSVWLAIRPPAHRRLLRIGLTEGRVRAKGAFSPAVAAWALGIAVALLMASPVGVVVAVVTALVARRAVARLESRSSRERRLRLVAQMPSVCDLLAAVLASGAPIAQAIGAVADASGSPAADSLGRVHAALQLGAAPPAAWQQAGVDVEFTRVAAAFERSARSGAPIVDVLVGLADDERLRRRRTIEIAARSAGVRAVAPLAACFLPAFILLGIVPVIASMATQMFHG